ncbi:MAG: hypothetical protein ACLRWP_19115 [Bilophila wadsworthia]
MSGETTPCCGYGGLTWDANPQLASAIAADRAGQLEHDAVTSCIMCRERLVAEGKPSLHMLDLLYPGESFMRRRPQKEAGFRHGARGVPRCGPRCSGDMPGKA